MKEEDVSKFLVGGTHLGGTNLDFQRKQHLCKRKSDGVYVWNKPGRSCYWQLLPLLTLKILLRSCHILQDDWPAGCAEVCCSHREPLLLLAASLLESSLTRSRLPSANCSFWWLLIPGPSDLTFPTLLWIKQTLSLCTLLCCTWARAFTQWFCCIRRRLRKVYACVASSPASTRERSHLLSFYRDLEEMPKEEQATTAKIVTKEELQGEPTASAAEFMVPDPEAASWAPLSAVCQHCRVRLFVTPWTVAYEAPPSMGFSRQEYWSGLPFPSPGDLPHPGIEPWSSALQADALPSKPPGKAFQVPSAVFHDSLLRRSQPTFLGPHCSQSIGTS